MHTVIERLKVERERRGLTLRELAPLVGAHFTTLQQYEAGVTDPTFAKLVRWCEALKLELSAHRAEPMTSEQREAMAIIAGVIPRLPGPLARAAAAAISAMDVKEV